MIKAKEKKFQVIEYSNRFYAIDYNSWDIFEVNNIFAEINNLIHSFSEKEIIDRLKDRYTLNDIRKEIIKIKEYFSIKSKTELKKQDDIVYKRITYHELKKYDLRYINNELREEYILVLTMSEFNNKEIINLLDQTNIFILLNIDENEIRKNDMAFKNLKKYLTKRQGRFRINVLCEDFVKCYNTLTKENIKNFDIQLKQGYESRIDESKLTEIRNLLMETFHNENEPNLAVIKDIIKIMAFKLNYNKECPVNCIGSSICTINDNRKNLISCSLNKIYCDLGVLYFIKYTNLQKRKMYKILVEDLNTGLTNKEKLIFSKSVYWSKNLDSIYKDCLVSMYKNKKNDLITFKDLYKSNTIMGMM